MHPYPCENHDINPLPDSLSDYDELDGIFTLDPINGKCRNIRVVETLWAGITFRVTHDILTIKQMRITYKHAACAREAMMKYFRGEIYGHLDYQISLRYAKAFLEITETS